jgi:hypothetical protein
MQCFSFCVWVISYSVIISSRFIHVVANCQVLLLGAEEYSIVCILYITFSLSLHPFKCWWTLQLFDVLVIVNNFLMNIGI